jgi:hypothetical protein
MREPGAVRGGRRGCGTGRGAEAPDDAGANTNREDGMTRWVAAAAAALLVCAAGRADAQHRAGRWDVAAYAGGSVTSRWFESRTVTAQDGELIDNDDAESHRPGYGPMFGVQTTLWASPSLGFRLHGGYAALRAPSTFGIFENATERAFHTLNTYVYDLDVLYRPWIMADVDDRLSSVYFFAGGGGVTVDVAGDGGGASCEPGLRNAGACLPYEREAATVGQGTAGAGMDLLRFTRDLALYGEAGVHVYDSPVHVGDEWLGGPVMVRNGGTVRVADDRTAVTTRLVLGVKWTGGDLMPTPPAPPSPPPPPPPAPPPPHGLARDIRVCVVENGMLTEIAVQYDATTGDSTVAGRPFREAHPAGAGYAGGAPWYIGNEPVVIGGVRYLKYGLPRVVGTSDVTSGGTYMGVPVFTERGPAGTPDVIYLPVRPGCEVQPYQREQEVRRVRG